MVVIISDLHITDGSTARNVDPSAFMMLKDEILSNVITKGATELHLVLLGDIFDLVRTDYWSATIPYNQRPWNGTIDPATGMNNNAAEVERQFNVMLDRILQATDKSAASLIFVIDSLSASPELKGKPVRITYVTGNHDKVFNNFPSLRQKVLNQFKNIKPVFDTRVFAPEYGLLARHGHEWDSDCSSYDFWTRVLHSGDMIDRFDPRINNVMSLGEVITAELMSGLIYNCRQRFRELGLTSDDDKQLLDGLMDVNDLRPMTDVFMWLRWFTRNNEEKYEKPIASALLDALDAVVNSSFANLWDRIGSFDLTDKLKLVRFGLNTAGFDLAEKVMDLAKNFGAGTDDLVAGAKQEFFAPTRDKRIHYIVYGHTHEALQNYFSGDRDLMMYINTGTYLPFLQMAEEQRGFVAAHRMTVATFCHAGEDVADRADGMPTLDLWNGIRKKNYKYTPIVV